MTGLAASAPYRERDLTPLELKTVAKTLGANHLLALPDQLGHEVKVNPHVLTLTFGKRKSELILQGEESAAEQTKLPADDHQAAPWRDFMAIVRALDVLAKDRPRTGEERLREQGESGTPPKGSAGTIVFGQDLPQPCRIPPACRYPKFSR